MLTEVLMTSKLLVGSSNTLGRGHEVTLLEWDFHLSKISRFKPSSHSLFSSKTVSIADGEVNCSPVWWPIKSYSPDVIISFLTFSVVQFYSFRKRIIFKFRFLLGPHSLHLSKVTKGFRLWIWLTPSLLIILKVILGGSFVTPSVVSFWFSNNLKLLLAKVHRGLRL